MPVVGVVPAIVFYRFQLVNPFRCYVPFGSALLAKWLGRFACIGVLSVQWIPLVGGVSLPIMATINYAIYRRAFHAAWRSGGASRANRRALQRLGWRLTAVGALVLVSSTGIPLK